MFNLTGDEQVGIVYQTKDYSKFSIMKYNREIDYKHVERLKKEMEDNDVNTPIQVTEKNGDGKHYIMDGQHVFEVRRSLDRAIRYVINKTDNPEKAVISMNTNKKNWRNDDYGKIYAEKEKESHPLDYEDMPYSIWKKARDSKLHQSTLLELAYGSREKKYSDCFRNNKLIIEDKEKFKEDANYLVSAIIHNKICKIRHFQLALCKALLNDNFDRKVFLTKMEKYPYMLKRCNDITSYYLNIEQLYNYYNKKSIKLI